MPDAEGTPTWKEMYEQAVLGPGIFAAQLQAENAALRAEVSRLRGIVQADLEEKAEAWGEVERLRDAMEQAEAELSFYGPAEYAGKARKILRDAMETTPSPGVVRND